jgi:hypothetical protein
VPIKLLSPETDWISYKIESKSLKRTENQK